MLELNEKLFSEKITKNQENCVVLFSKATCHICQQVMPILEELETEYEKQPVSFCHVDAVAEKNLMERLSLKGVPQVLFFQHGESRGKYAGIREAEEYKEKIEALLHA